MIQWAGCQLITVGAYDFLVTRELTLSFVFKTDPNQEPGTVFAFAVQRTPASFFGKL